MSLHEADLKARLARYLDRRQMPRRLEGKGGAMEDEVRALVAALGRVAPRSTERLADWWHHFESALGEIATGGLWPTEREIRDAAKMVGSIAPQVAVAPEPKSEHQIIADRMARGDPVGEGWLYGRAACELIRQRLVDQATMSAYRSGAFFARKATYGQEAALAWETEAKAKHEAAKEAFRDDTPHHGPVSVEAKRFGDAA